MKICHEAIYQALCVQGLGPLRRGLCACLHMSQAVRVSRAESAARQAFCQWIRCDPL